MMICVITSSLNPGSHKSRDIFYNCNDLGAKSMLLSIGNGLAYSLFEHIIWIKTIVTAMKKKHKLQSSVN